MFTFSIILLLCAFLTIGINLWQTARDNHELMLEEYTTVAFPTFQGNVTSSASLTSDTESAVYEGYKQIFAEDFDEAVFESASGTKALQIQRQFGGYINSETRIADQERLTQVSDIIIFTYLENTPQTISWNAGTDNTKISRMQLDWSAAGFESIPIVEAKKYADGFWRGFRFYNHVDSFAIKHMWGDLLEDSLWVKDENGKPTMDLCLEPGKQYIATGQWAIACTTNSEGHVLPGSEELSSFGFRLDEAHAVNEMRYQFGDWEMLPQPDVYSVTYPCIMPYTEDFWETDAGKYYQDAIEVTAVNARSVTMVATPDLSLYRPFYEEGVYISDGRGFEPADYEAGSKVCLVSQYLADLNGWQIADVLDLSFYPSNYSYSRKASDVQSFYEPLRERIHEETGETELYVEDIFLMKAGLRSWDFMTAT